MVRDKRLPPRADVAGLGTRAAALQEDSQGGGQACGISCPKHLVWHDWTPGQEYSQTLLLRNQRGDTQMLRVGPPSSRGPFLIDGTPPVSLVSGATHSVVVRFRPQERIPYEDRLEVRTKLSALSIPLLATLPQIECTMPDEVDMGQCAVQQWAERPVVLSNAPSGVPVAFEWRVEAPFRITPRTGDVEPGQSCTMSVGFRPAEAAVFVGSALCHLTTEEGDSKVLTLRLTGVGKYPFLRSSVMDVDFGTVACGQESTRSVALSNPSPVSSQFTVARAAVSGGERRFHAMPSRGIIAAGSTVPLQVTFRPRSGDGFVRDILQVKTPAGHPIDLRVSGHGIGPEVTASVRCLDFGDCPFGAVVERHFRLVNQSTCGARFHWVRTQPGCAFEFVYSSGTIMGRSGQRRGGHTCTVRFRPSAAIPYARRCFCLVEGQGTLVSVDLVGRGHEASAMPPESSSASVPTAREIPDDHRALAPLEDPWGALFRLFDGSPAAPCAITTPALDFGFLMPSTVERRSVYVRNRTAGTVRAEWSVPDGPVRWAIHPAGSPIAPFSCQEFSVELTSECLNPFYATVLECYVVSAGADAVSCLDLEVFAHTCSPLESREAIPRLSRNSVSFPASQPGMPQYLTVVMANEGDQPFRFRLVMGTTETLPPKGRPKAALQGTMLASESTKGSRNVSTPRSDSCSREAKPTISCIPESGVVPPGGHHVVAFRLLAPAGVGWLRAECTFHINHDGGELMLHLEARAGGPVLGLADDAPVAFRPSLIGVESMCRSSTENLTGHAVRFDWRIPPALRGVVRVTPPSGILRAGERKDLTVFFRPAQAQPYQLDIPCWHSPVEDPETEGCAVLTVVGEGQEGGIAMEPRAMDFGAVLVATSATRRLTLFNATDCDLRYALRHSLFKGSTTVADESIFHLLPESGVLPGRTHLSVQLTFIPPTVGEYNLHVYCDVEPPGSEAAGTSSSHGGALQKFQQATPQCEVVGHGARPLLQVADVFSPLVSRARLWHMLQIDALNALLSGDPTAAEQQPEHTITLELARCPSVDMDLGVFPVSDMPVVIDVMLTNPGPLPAPFLIKLPWDSDLVPETWWPDLASGVPVEPFDVHPRKGLVGVGEATVVQLICDHIRATERTLPILFAIPNGRRVCWSCRVTTLEPEGVRLLLPPSSHELYSTLVGHSSVQYIELRNPTSRPIPYRVSAVTPESLSTAIGSGFPILQCQNVAGVVPPRGTGWVPWRFTPLAAVSYVVNYTIHLDNTGTAYYASFRAEGVAEDAPHKRTLPESLTLPPTTPQLVSTQLPVLLVPATVKFGTLPFYSLTRRAVILVNHSHDQSFFFSWDVTLPAGPATIDIEPQAGTLGPNQSMACQLSLATGGMPQILEFDLTCNLLNQQDNKAAITLSFPLPSSSSPQPTAGLATSTPVPSSRAPAPPPLSHAALYLRVQAALVTEDQCDPSLPSTVWFPPPTFGYSYTPPAPSPVTDPPRDRSTGLLPVALLRAWLSDVIREVVRDPVVLNGCHSNDLEQPYYCERVAPIADPDASADSGFDIPLEEGRPNNQAGPNAAPPPSEVNASSLYASTPAGRRERALRDPAFQRAMEALLASAVFDLMTQDSETTLPAV